MTARIILLRMPRSSITRTTLGDQFSEGARLLWQEMRKRGVGHNGLGRLLGMKPGVVNRWLYGDTRPKVDWALRVRDVLGIPLEAWREPPKRQFAIPEMSPVREARSRSPSRVADAADEPVPAPPASGPSLPPPLLDATLDEDSDAA